MTSNIRQTCLYLSTTKNIGNIIHQTYSRTRGASQIYELKLKMINLRHEERTMTNYTNELMVLW